MNGKNSHKKQLYQYALRKLNREQIDEDSFNEFLQYEIQWEDAAVSTNVDGNKLKRWYKETYLRHKTGQLLLHDSQLLKILVFELLDNGGVWDKNYKEFIKGKLSKQYHKITFDIAFNNCVKSWKRFVPDRLLKDLLALNLFDLDKYK